MASGCNSGGYSNLFTNLTPDTGVKYTGPAIPSLGICTGDTLSEVEASVLTAIVNYSTGIGIELPNISMTECNLFSQYITCCGQGCTDLPCLMDVVFKSLCTLYSDFTTLQTEITSLLSGYNTACLSGVTSSSTLQQVVQELINEFCTLTSTVAGLSGTIPTTTTINTLIGTYLASHITSCQTGVITVSGTGASTSLAFSGFTPIGGIIMWYPTATVTVAAFDANGKGYINGPACGWQMCNGNNGTPNLCGLSPIGTTDMGTPIGGLTPPSSLAISSGVSGQYQTTLSAAQSGIAPHSHPVTDLGHTHPLKYYFQGVNGGGSGAIGLMDGVHSSSASTVVPGNDPSYTNVQTASTGITVGTSSGSDATSPVSLLHPVLPIYYLQRIS